MHSSNSSHCESSTAPKVRRMAIAPRFSRAAATEIYGQTQIENRATNRSAKGRGPAHLSSQKSVAAPEPIWMEVPMRRTGNKDITDCQNWEPPDLEANANGCPRRYFPRII